MSDEKKYANGGQIGKSSRIARLKGQILGREKPKEIDPLDEFDIAEEPIVDEFEDPKVKRMERINDILSKIKPF